MNDDRSQTESADAFPTPVNSQVTDSVETGGDGGVPVAPTKLGAIPASYGEAGGMAGEGEPSAD
ncbi:MAG: hypothetical protein QOI11_1933 [Candidatus Eremiobacteraeota bacterium]|jgi:hypothetical protein|nr:hypothetical protein [Candidatus Eremiobacteraeota bacterium]